MPSDLALKTMNGVHRALLAVSFGRVGRRFGGMQSLELTTTGRKSGQSRATMLTAPVIDGDTVVVVASRGGDPTDPAWYKNLEAEPRVTVRLIGSPARPMRARTVTGDERDHLWQRIVTAQPRYAGYQSKTDRVIPVVVLEPVA